VADQQTDDARLKRALGYPYGVTAQSFTLIEGEVAPFDLIHIAGRTPVIGYGSNQSPERLRQKYGTSHTPIAVQRARLADHDVVYSAHLAIYGALPAALRHTPGTTVEVAINWLSREQLAVMHPSEAHNYYFAHLAPIALETAEGERLGHGWAYLSHRGHFAVAGAPLALAEIRAEGRSLEAVGQAEALELARAQLAPSLDLPAFVHSTIDNRATRHARIEALSAAAIPVAHGPHDVIATEGVVAEY
jgi:hypothetical protein